MTNLILHIGGPKTGSSSIQKFLTINSKKLREQKIFIPTFLGEEGHHWLALLAFTEDRVEDLVTQYGLNNPIKRQPIIFTMKTSSSCHRNMTPGIAPIDIYIKFLI